MDVVRTVDDVTVTVAGLALVVTVDVWVVVDVETEVVVTDCVIVCLSVDVVALIVLADAMLQKQGVLKLPGNPLRTVIVAFTVHEDVVGVQAGIVLDVDDSVHDGVVSVSL